MECSEQLIVGYLKAIIGSIVQNGIDTVSETSVEEIVYILSRNRVQG